jgi:DNA replicative helicase MCM subunit Mcm2 (Cdc46/Mcm family)
MRLQETPDEIPEGGTPHTVSLLLHDKLVDTGKPGDRVEVRLYHDTLINRYSHVCSMVP